MIKKIKKDYQIKNLNEAFTMIPNFIIFDTRLSANEYRLLSFYISVSINKNTSFYSIKKICELINLSNKTIIKANKTLEKLKYINIKTRFNNSNIITVLKYSYGKNTQASVKNTPPEVKKLHSNNIKYNNINLKAEVKNHKEITKEEQDFINNLKKSLNTKEH